MDSAKVVQIYLDELGEMSQLPLSLGVVRLIVESEQTAPEQARLLIRRTSQEPMDALSQATLIQAISTIMVYKFSRLSREEVEKMLGLTHRLRDTRVYQEALEEALEEGLAEGLAEGLKASVVEVLSVRFGTVPEAISQRLETVTDVAVLKELLRQAIAVEAIAEFVQQLA